jgi:hypothetical protein
MLKLLLLAALLALLGRMVGDLWRQWIAVRLGRRNGVGRSMAPPTRLLQCRRCGVYSPAPRFTVPGAVFLCRQCQTTAA